MIDHLPLSIEIGKGDAKDDLKKKFIHICQQHKSLTFKSLKYPEITNITELLCYLKLENPRRRMTSKEKDNIIALSKKIIHFCDVDYSIELSDYNTTQEVIDDVNYIRQYGDLLSVRKACEKYNKQGGIVKLEPIVSLEKKEMLRKKRQKKSIASRVKFQRKQVIIDFD
tara:strand:+ start:517 stop:1023 length:507 start_codon:yes stop_codon:yes gene_type:complete